MKLLCPEDDFKPRGVTVRSGMVTRPRSARASLSAALSHTFMWNPLPLTFSQSYNADAALTYFIRESGCHLGLTGTRRIAEATRGLETGMASPPEPQKLPTLPTP